MSYALLIKQFGRYGMVDVGINENKYVSVALERFMSGSLFYDVIGVHSNFDDAYDTARALDKSGVIIECKFDENTHQITRVLP